MTNLYSFGRSSTDGDYPYAGLVQGSDGNLYGTTAVGGTSGTNGTVFRISPSGSYTSLYSFVGYPNDGSDPYAGLVQGSDGNFYGTTRYGGTSTNCQDEYGNIIGCGTVFRISPSGSETVLYSFVGYPNDGSDPYAGLVQGSDGNFYGTTYSGGTSTNCGSYGCGTVFRISSGGSYSNLHSFGSSSPSDGKEPWAGVVQGSDGNFYGTTGSGGAYSWLGTVFRISPSGTYTTLYAYAYDPVAGLVQGSDGYFYGTTVWGGVNTNCGGNDCGCGGDGCGTVFRISPSGTYTTLYSFAGSPNDGGNPYAGLVQGSDGNFYGTTPNGGASGWGTVFRISPTGNETNLYSFDSFLTDGEQPAAALVQGSDGNFYGTTPNGGASGWGTVFQLDVGLRPNCGASINPTNAAFGTAGGSDSVSVTASNSCAWTATSNAGFITITSGTNGTGNGTVYYSVAANTTTTPLTGTMTIANQIFTVTQAGLPCSVSPDTTSASFGSGGGSSNVTVTANGTNCTWTASSNDSFIMITSGSSGSGNGTVDYSVVANTNAATRMGTMTIAGQTFTVTQPGGSTCSFMLGTTNAVFTAAGGSDSVSVTASNGCTWSASAANSWITIISGSSGTGNGTVYYTVAANTNASVQIGTITIAGQTFTITEAAPACSVSPTSTSANFGSAGGSSIVTVTASGTNCAWTAQSNDSFITITSGSSGSGNGTVDYTVAANTRTNELTGTMTIAGGTFTVTQSGASAESCTYTLSATSVTLPAKGGSKNVSVKVKGTDCSWTAVSNDPFITITSGSSGTGKGKVDYTVPGNTNTSPLSGTMTIAGETFTVNQAAGGCTFKLSPKSGKLKAAGGSKTVKVTPNLSDCDWTAVSNDPFITITSGSGGTGKGTVSYSVAANTNTTALTGSITIGGETFTVTQAGAK